jgi:hypothetical protein
MSVAAARAWLSDQADKTVPCLPASELVPFALCGKRTRTVYNARSSLMISSRQYSICSGVASQLLPNSIGPF